MSRRRNGFVFTDEHIDRLVTLNRRLAELEHWCLMRSKLLVENFMCAAGTPAVAHGVDDFELESRVYYYRFAPLESDQEELVLETDFIPMPPLKWYYLNPTPEHASDIFKFLHYNWHDGVEDIPRLNGERICWSFHDLHDHHHLDWHQILEVERVWLDVRAIHQHEVAMR